jgi:hypothetical protein
MVSIIYYNLKLIPADFAERLQNYRDNPPKTKGGKKKGKKKGGKKKKG